MSRRATTYALENNDTWEVALRKINTNFHNIIDDITHQETTGGGGSSAVKTHQDLGDSVNRPNCHPIGAVSNLQETLDDILTEIAKHPTTQEALKEAHPKTSLYMQKSSTLPTSFTSEMSWTSKGTTTIAGTTYYVWERDS